MATHDVADHVHECRECTGPIDCAQIPCMWGGGCEGCPDCDSDELDSAQFADLLADALRGDLDGDEPPIADVTTFSNAGILTMNDGLVVTLDDGTEYQVTVVKSRNASRN